MPIIKVSAQEIKAGLPIKNGWYPGILISIGAKASKDGKGIDFVVKCHLDDKSPAGRDIEQTLNYNYPPNKTLMGKLIYAADGKPMTQDPEDLEIDTDQYAGRKLNVQIKNDEYNGSLIPKFVNFLSSSIDVSTLPF